MSSGTTLSPTVTEAAARGAVYALLTHGLGYPTPHRWKTLTEVILPAVRTLEWEEPIASALADLGTDLPDPDDLKVNHLLIFPPIASQDAPAYETAYRGDDLFRQVDLMADVAGFYRAHGVQPGGEDRQRPDDITVELEFMAFVCRKEAAAIMAGELEAADVTRESGDKFLAEHLGCWGPSFGRRISAISRHPWYRSLGMLLATWLEAELLAAGLDPVVVADQPLPPPEPDDGVCGPCPVGSPS